MNLTAKTKFKVACDGREMLDLSKVDFPAGLRVQIVAPHSDDFDINAITLKYMQKAGAVMKLDVLSLDNGVEADFEPQTPQAQIRKREQLDSLAFFGLDVSMANFLDTLCDSTGQSIYHFDNIRLIEKSVNEFEPDIIIAPHPNDSNSAHRNVANMIYEINVKTDITVLHNQDPKTTEITPNSFMPFGSEQCQWKAELLRCHKSQHSRNLNTRGYGFDERLLSFADRIAKEHSLNCEYAEIFEICNLYSK